MVWIEKNRVAAGLRGSLFMIGIDQNAYHVALKALANVLRDTCKHTQRGLRSMRGKSLRRDLSFVP